MATSESGSECGEPLFKYRRLEEFPRTFFTKDPVSAALVTRELVAVGTHSGVLHLASSELKPLRTTRIHRASILDIKESNGFVFTGSIDGTVVASSVADAQNVHGSDTRRPVNALAPSPDYANTTSYLSGGTSGQVSLSSRGWIKARTEQIVGQEEGAILAVEWLDTRAIWCTQQQVTIWDSVGYAVLGRFPVQADMHKPRILVGTKTIVAFGKSLLFFDLNGATLERTLEVEWMVAGMAYFDDAHLLLLCTEPGEPAELRLVDLEGQETYVDELSMQGYERLKPNDYSLHSGKDKWYIFSANDAVLAQLRDQRDHLEWLLEEDEIEEAFSASVGVLDEPERAELGLRASNILFDQKSFTRCAHILHEVVPGSNVREWKNWAQRFIDVDEYSTIGSVLPTSLHELGAVYTKIAVWCAKHDPTVVSSFLQKWDPLALDKAKIIIVLEQEKHLETLAAFYVRLSEPYNATKCYLELGDRRAYELVEHYHLWNDMLPELGDILKLAPSLDGLLQSKLAASKVVDSLAGGEPDRASGSSKSSGTTSSRALLHTYLKALAKEDPFLVKNFGDLQVQLYAENEPAKLLGFLNINSNYDLGNAIRVCERHDLTNTLIYLYGRIGQTHRALDLIIKSGDPEAAVHFAASHNDSELWTLLVEYARSRPEYVLCLLRCPEVPPTVVLEAVPSTLRIPGLRNALRDLLASQKSTLVLNHGALSIVKAEARDHFDMLQGLRKRGESLDTGETDWSEPQLLAGELFAVEKADQKAHEPWLSFKVRHLVEALRYLN